MSIYFKLTISLGVCCLASLSAGCGGASSMVQVKGKILYAQKPLSASGLDTAIIRFCEAPSEGKLGNQYQGTFDEGGNYTLKAPAGRYKVIVIAGKAPKSKDQKSDFNYAEPVSVIPEVYGDITTTDQVVEVKADAGPDAYTINLKKL